MKVIIIIPTYNENETITRTIDAVEEVIKSETEREIHLLIVDGNSPDGTAQAVESLKGKYLNLHLLLEEKKAGLGAAYLQAMEVAFGKMEADVVFEFDGDLSHDPKKIPAFLREIDKGADLVLGSRYIKGGSIPGNWAIHRKFLSIAGNLYINMIMLNLKPRDWTTGYRAIKKWVYYAVMDNITEFRGYTFQIGFLYNAVRSKAKIAEVPINFIDRKFGKSKMPGFEYIAHTLYFITIARINEILHSKFMKFATVGFIGYLINAIGMEIFYKAGVTPGLAASLGAELAIISNFTLNNLWTFSEKKISGTMNIVWKFLQFNLTSFGAVIIQGVVVGTLARLFGSQWRQIYLVFAIGLFVMPYNYSMYNIFIWKRWKVPFLTKGREPNQQ